MKPRQRFKRKMWAMIKFNHLSDVEIYRTKPSEGSLELTEHFFGTYFVIPVMVTEIVKRKRGKSK